MFSYVALCCYVVLYCAMFATLKCVLVIVNRVDNLLRIHLRALSSTVAIERAVNSLYVYSRSIIGEVIYDAELFNCARL